MGEMKRKGYPPPVRVMGEIPLDKIHFKYFE